MDIGEVGLLDEIAETLVSTINRNGYAVLRDYVPPAELARMRAFVAKSVAGAEGAYVGFTTLDGVAGSGLDTIGRSPDFRALVERVYEVGTGRKATNEPFYQVLRCLTGRSSTQHSLLFHYDSYVVTVLIPVEIPKAGQTGDLIMLANTRKIRSSYYRNVLDKVMLDNKATQYVLRLLHRAGWLPLTRLKLQPGSAYFFWGYRSVHTNEACDLSSVRATALYHYGNPHLGRSRRARHV